MARNDFTSPTAAEAPEPPEPAAASGTDVQGALVERSWRDLPTIADVELWIVEHDLELQRHVTRSYSTGHGICFTLAAGGEIYLHTTGDGDVVLDVTPEAAWAAPVITAATRVPAPSSQMWVLPGDVLTQLVLGLNSLILSSRLVLSHQFRARR